MFYSKSTGGFYTSEIHGGNIPKDAVEITDEIYREAFAGQAAGLQILPDANGMPRASEIEKKPVSVLQSQVKAELRTMRAPMLDALIGIAGRAVRAGNDALAAEADALAVQLLDVTNDAALNAATTFNDMQTAGVAAYKRIAGTASPELGVVFREITGA